MSVHDAATTVAGNSSQTAPETGRIYPALDGLRAIAFTLVFLMHYFRLPFGWGGVNLFFVLSGFLITGILLDTRSDRHRARNFYLRRTLRIFPLYYGVCLALLLLYPLLHWRWSVYWLAWPLYFGNFLRFLSPQAAVLNTPLEHAADGWLVIGRFPKAAIYLGPFWSLCVEEQFYLIWPWLVFFFSSRSIKRVCVFVVIATPMLRLVLQHTMPAWLIRQELLYRFTPLQLDSLLGGALLAILLREGYLSRMAAAARFFTPVLIVCALACVMAHLSSLHISAFPVYVYPAWKFSLGLTYINVLGASLIVNCVSGAGSICRTLQFAPFRWVGRLTYGAYVFHDLFHDVYAKLATMAAGHFALSPGSTTVATAAIAYPSTLCIAWLSFQVLEKPFLNLKNRYTVRAKRV